MIKLGNELVSKDLILRVYANPMAHGDYFQTCTVVLKDGRSFHVSKTLDEMEKLLS